MSEHEGDTGTKGSVELPRVRQLWHLLEPLHAVLYYAPEAFEAPLVLRGISGACVSRCSSRR